MHRPRTRRADQLHSQKSHRTRAQPRRHIGCPLQALPSIFTQRSIQPKMARTTLALLLASRAAALVPTLRTTSISKTISRVSYLSEVEDADKKKKWWDQDDEGREESNPRDHTGVGEADSNYGPTNYEGFIDADGFDGGDGQVGVVGDGKNHMEEFDMSAEDSRGLKGGRKLNQMGGRESKLNAKNAWGTTTGYAEELAKRGMVEIDEYGEDKLARRRQQLENWRNQEELRMKKTIRWPSSRRSRARSTATSTTAPTSSSSTTGRRTRCRRSRFLVWLRAT